MQTVKVASVKQGKYYCGTHTSGSTKDVTLTNGVQNVTCEDILIWEEEDLEELFEEWAQYAEAGEEGYTLVTI